MFSASSHSLGVILSKISLNVISLQSAHLTTVTQQFSACSLCGASILVTKVQDKRGENLNSKAISKIGPQIF